MTRVTRFAPSPTGFLHLGHAHSALIAHEAARAVGGLFLLRIEDIDQTRCREDFVAAILEDLAWLGLVWDGPVRRQSEHFADYARLLDRLRAMGLLYPCFCTRAAILAEIRGAAGAPQGPEGPLYPGTCRHLDPAARADRLARGDNHAWRLDVARAARTVGSLRFIDHGRAVDAHPSLLGDVVLARKDTPASYHLAVVHDDHVQGVTLVTRGEDLLHATHVHRLLQAVLGYDPPDYAHHALLRAADGRRLAKRDGAAALRQMRRDGLTPAQVRALAGVQPP